MKTITMSREFRLGVYLAAAVLFAGCASTGSKKAAIESVFEQRGQIKARYAKASNIEEMAANAERIVAGYKAINVTHCPEDFRSAWFDYLVEVESTNAKRVALARQALANGKNEGDLDSLAKLVGAYLTAHASPMAAIGMLASIEPKKSGPKNAEVAHQMLAAQQGLDEAWKKLERVAMNYGVVPIR